VTVENEAEGKVLPAEFAFLERNTRKAFDDLMLHARCVIICRPTAAA
jgi:hypothetical protein